MTPSNKRASRSDDSADSGSKFWATDCEVGSADDGSGDDDGFHTVTGKAVKKKNMRLSTGTLDSFRKPAGQSLPKTPRKGAKAPAARCAPTAPKTTEIPQTSGAAATGPVTGVD